MSKSRVRRTAAARKGSRSKREEHEEHPFERRLRAVVSTIDVVQTLTAPLILSIKNLLSVAASSFNCDEASVIVRDDEDGSLKFLCAIGQVAEQLMQVRIPQGRGIAGFVLECGQPMAVADASRESSFYADIDRATGYSTQTLLATPLTVDGRTIGVLEFINRIDGPPFQPFSSEEMDRAAHFAAAIAPLVAAHERTGLVETLFAKAMTQALQGDAALVQEKHEEEAALAGEASDEEGAGAASSSSSSSTDLARWLDEVRAAPEHRDLLRLAVLLRDVAGYGDAERAMCRGVLETLAAFIKQGAGGSSDRTFLS